MGLPRTTTKTAIATDVSCFTAGEKVAIQAWFGSCVITDKSRKTTSRMTFRLLETVEAISEYFYFVKCE